MSYTMSCFSSTREQFQDMFSTLQSCSSSFHIQQGIRKKQRFSMFVAGRKESNCNTPPDQDGVSSLCQERHQKQLWIWEQNCRKVKDGINSSRGYCSVYLGTEGDSSTGQDCAGGVQSLAPEKSWVSDMIL